MSKKKSAVKQNETALTIPEIKTGDFQEQTGIVPKEYTRAVKVNDFTTNLKVTLKLNHKKNSYEVNSRILWSQVSNEAQVMLAVFQSKYSLEMHAIKMGEKWRLERMADQKPVDPDQVELEMGFAEEDDEHGVPQVGDNE